LTARFKTKPYLLTVHKDILGKKERIPMKPFPLSSIAKESTISILPIAIGLYYNFPKALLPPNISLKRRVKQLYTFLVGL